MTISQQLTLEGILDIDASVNEGSSKDSIDSASFDPYAEFKIAKEEYYQYMMHGAYEKKSFSIKIKDFLVPYALQHSETDNHVKYVAHILAGKSKNEKGKRIWKWEDRVKECEQYMRKNKLKKSKDLEVLDGIIHTGYMKKNHGKKLQRLDAVLCSPTPARYVKDIYTSVIKMCSIPLKYLSAAALGAGIMYGCMGAHTKNNLTPIYKSAKIHFVAPVDASYDVHTMNSQDTHYVVNSGDNLWSIVKNYAPKHINSNILYATVDSVAKENGFGLQKEYTIKDNSARNPHLIKPGFSISLKSLLRLFK